MARKAAKTANVRMERTVFHVVPFGNCWAVKVEGRIVDIEECSKSEILEYQRERCALLKAKGVLCQIVVHKRDGTIQCEYTYGEDPRETKG